MTYHQGSISSACLALALALTPNAHAQKPPAKPNELNETERLTGWRLLFDGRTLKGWRGLGYDTVPSAHWVVENGAIKKIASGKVARMRDGQPAKGGDLMTVDTFKDFELTWEWKFAPGSNSGVKYNVSEAKSMTRAANHEE